MRAFPLHELCEIRPGYQFRQGLGDEVRDGEPVQVIQIKDIENLHFRPKHLELARIRQADRYRVHQGDVLLLTRGHRFGATVIDVPVESAIAVYFFSILTPKTAELDAAFLAWHLNHPRTQAELKQKAHAVHMPFLSPKEVRDLITPLPPLAVQRQIAEFDVLQRREAHLTARLLEKRTQMVNALTLQMASGQLQISPSNLTDAPSPAETLPSTHELPKRKIRHRAIDLDLAE
ncbi:MAG TPA: restriction endonuclease subunit S [Abditibacterium sp.]|jgi:hypothetical protein